MKVKSHLYPKPATKTLMTKEEGNQGEWRTLNEARQNIQNSHKWKQSIVVYCHTNRAVEMTNMK